MKKPLLTVLIANIVMTFTATAPVYSMSEGHINHWGFAVILGSLAAMNLLAGVGLSFFDVPEGRFFKRFGLAYFVVSIALFVLPF